MTRSRFRGALGPALVLSAMVAVVTPLPALAQRAPDAASKGKDETPAPAGSVSSGDRAKAEEHFNRAKELYGAGKYAEAISELEAARALDPKARDLVMNLGIVNEKLGKYDEAISWFKTYLEMEGVTPQERAKAEGSIKRLEGAKREVVTPPVASTGSTSSPPPAPTPARDAPERGRIDAATIAAASVAVVALGVGTYFGIHSLATRPEGFVTGRDGSYAALKERADDAHTSAIVADVGFAVGIVALLATAYLYLGRHKDAPPARAAAWSSGRSGFVTVPLP